MQCLVETSSIGRNHYLAHEVVEGDEVELTRCNVLDEMILISRVEQRTILILCSTRLYVEQDLHVLESLTELLAKFSDGFELSLLPHILRLGIR